MTVRDLLSIIQRQVSEPAADGGRTWALGLWNEQEILAYLYAVELEFIRRTPVVRGWAIEPYAPGQAVVPISDEIQEILHAETDQEDRGAPLPASDRHATDHAALAWNRTVARPRVYTHEDTETSTVTLAPVPSAAGQLHLLVVPTPQTHTRTAGDDDTLTVGPLWEPFIIAGVLARMYAKPGEAFHPDRRDRYTSLFELGIALALQRARA